MIKIIFCSDLHGSTVTWRKFINLFKEKDGYLFICSGDLFGKFFGIVKNRNSGYELEIDKENLYFKNDKKLSFFLQTFGMKGGYWLKDEELPNEKKLSKIINNLKINRLQHWINNLENIINNNTILITRGNDDPLIIDSQLTVTKKHIIFDNNDFNYQKYTILSYPFVNFTPWQTPGEKDEKVIYNEISSKIKEEGRNKNYIFNFHCPPINTNLDIAPKLDKDFSLSLGSGGTETVHVGSKSIRKIIEDYQPVISLHGHIHESKGVDKLEKTYCFNPGSEYENGILKYFEIFIDEKHKIKFWHHEI